MKKKILTSALAFAIVALLSLGMVNQAQSADYAPGEGAYLGAFFGSGMGILSAKVQTLANGKILEDGTYETDRGGLGFEGIQGGGWLGYGLKTADDLYFGFEATAAASDEKFELTGTPGIHGGGSDDRTRITTISAERNWTAGGALRVGYYINGETLFALKGGIAVSQFDVKIGADSNTYYGGGPQVGASIESRLSKVDPNLSLRIEYVYTDYLTADVFGFDGLSGTLAGNGGNNSELTGQDSAGRIGLTYSFADLGALF